MKRIVIRTVLVLVLLFVFIAGTLSLIRGFTASRLERYKASLAAKDEKLRPSELITGPVVSNTLIPRLTAANRHFGRAPPDFDLMHSSAQPAWKRTNDWPAMHRLLDAAEIPLSQIREALRVQPRDLGWDQTNWNAYPSTDGLIQVRVTSFWLSASVAIELNRRRTAEAVTNLLSLLDLAHCHADERTLVYQMTRVALSGFASEASWELLQANGWTDAQLARLQNSWQNLSILTPIELTLQMERARGLNYFLLARGRSSDDPRSSEPPDSFSDALYAPMWNVVLAGGDELHFVQTMQKFLEGLRSARQNSSGAAYEKGLGEMNKRRWLADYRFPMARVLLPNIHKALKRAIKGEAQRQITIAAIGLERYRLRHGHYPERLDQLVPDILATVPVDFGDGKPLRYKQEGETFRLWSVQEGVLWPQGEAGIEDEDAGKRRGGLNRE